MDGLSLSPVAMFLQASPIGKAVMAILLVASLWCWILIIEGVFTVMKLSRALAAARTGKATAVFAPIDAAGIAAGGLAVAGESSSEKRQRYAEKMSRAGRELLMRAEGGLPNLAVISSVAPFIGLFGTVWGIMTSFAGIAEAKDTSLAVVAPGIAEALAATAYGLAAAIPASIGYNRIGAAFSHVGVQLSHLIEDRAEQLAATSQLPAKKDAA
ncbi:MotA/TolQ/ExbB proton channel family protein [Rhodoblastus sp.]|uniref:MotA/TolQ/ExbB proton channel family protein n=1 Tax=Rhodoblastus sp. TaxID=1962975 RepID=UPI003F9D7A41